MRKVYCLIIVTLTLVFNSCVVSKKKYDEALSEQTRQEEELMDAKNSEAQLKSTVQAMKANESRHDDEIAEYKEANKELTKELRAEKASTERYVDEIEQLKSTPNKIVYRKVVVHETDTVEMTSHEINSGKVAFYCPTEMYMDETYDAFGLIADVLSDEDVKEMVVENIKQHMSDTAVADFDDDEFLIKAVQYFDLIELQLLNVKEDGFEITKAHVNDRKQITDNDNKWHWKVTPKSASPNQQLMLNVLIYDAEGNLNNRYSKTYHFDVTIRPNRFFHNTKELFVENPEWAFGSIILPFITYVAGRFQRRKKKTNNVA